MNTYKEALEKVMMELNGNFNKANNENMKKVNELFDYIELINEMYKLICNNKSKDVLAEAQNDLLSSLIFCFQGYYRQANICLRSSLELVLSFLYYYDHQYDFILWENNCIDMTWTQLIDKEKGVFNEKFLSIVNDKPISIIQCLKEIKKLYHLTSQYVHGKYEYMQNMLSIQIKYSEDLVKHYFETSYKIIQLEIIMLFLRFSNEIKLDPNYVNKIKVLIKKYEVINNE